MAVKKPATRKRSTTKATKTTRATTKRATKSKVAKPAAIETIERIEETPAVEAVEVAPASAPAAPSPEPARPVSPRSTSNQPSRYTGDHYLHATVPKAEDVPIRRPGKWLIFVSRSRVDALWETIRRAVEKGRLGHAAKVSTALPEPTARDPKKHVIAVYTADETNATDVRRVRDVLRGLGITWRIPYKSDAAALAGQNDDMAGGPATKYYE
jgi:hypothetical protein